MLLSLKVDVVEAMKKGVLYDSESQTMLISQADLDTLTAPQRELLADALRYNKDDDVYDVHIKTSSMASCPLVLSSELTLASVIKVLEAKKAEFDKQEADRQAAKLQAEQERTQIALELLNTFTFGTTQHNNAHISGEFRSCFYKSSYMHPKVTAYERELRERYPEQLAAYEAKLEEVKQQQMQDALLVVEKEEQEILDWIQSHGSLSLRDKVKNKESFMPAYIFEYDEYKRWKFHNNFDQVYKPLGFVLTEQLTRSDFSEYATPTNNQYLKLKNLQSQFPECKWSLLQIDDPESNLGYLLPDDLDIEHLFNEDNHLINGVRPHPSTIVIRGELDNNYFYLPDLDAVKALIHEVDISL